jgi:hypothetical protein
MGCDMLETCRRQESDVPLPLADEELRIGLISKNCATNSVDQGTRRYVSSEALDYNDQPVIQQCVTNIFQRIRPIIVLTD